MKLTATLHNMQQGYSTIDAMWKQVKPWLAAGHKLQIEIKQQTRSTEQNSKFHAICSDIAKSGLNFAGKERTATEWKVLLISGHSVATKQGAEIVPGIEGEFVNIRESSATMSIKRKSSLIEYAIAFGVSNGVRFTAPEYAEAE